MHQSSSLLELYLFKAKNNHSLDPGHTEKITDQKGYSALISFINGMASQRREGIFITDKNFIDFLIVCCQGLECPENNIVKKQLLCETRKPCIKL